MVWSPGQKLFGDRYVIVQKLGEGGMGVTYLARNQDNQLRVIKTLRKEILYSPAWKPHREKLRQDFRDEAVRLAVCRHPHIVQIENIFDQGNLPCMVMEYIRGEDLGHYLRRMKMLPEAEALLYIRQIGDALSVIHRRGLLHRDIKPRNIIIRQGKSSAVLIDFGIAREFIPNVVQKHTVFRTPGFAPPEQYEIVAPRGEFIDVYALSATLYTLLTGVVPTSAENRHKNTTLQSPQHFNPRISDQVNRAIMQGMALQANYRPQSVEEWLQLLGDSDEEEFLPPTLVILRNTQSPQINPNPPNSGSESNVVSAQQWKCVHTLRGNAGMVHAIAISPDSQLLASGSSNSAIKIWDIRNGKLLRQLGRWFGHSGAVDSLVFSNDGQILASGSWDETIKLWSVSTGRQIRTLKGHSHWVNSLAMSLDGQLLVSGSVDCTIKMWLVSTGREMLTIKGHGDSVASVAISPNGLLASGSADYTVKLWQLSTGREISTLRGHSLFVNSVAYSSDGEVLASCSADNTIKLWLVSTGEEIRTLSGHSDVVWAIALSPDQQFLASGSSDKTIKIWETATGREICTLRGHTNYVKAIAISSNGQILVSGSDDDTIKIWQQ